MTGKYFHTKENGDNVEVPRLRVAMIITKTTFGIFKNILLILNQVSPTKHNLSLLAIVIVCTAFYIRPNNDRSTPVTFLLTFTSQADICEYTAG
jgi:hypothetical protein